MIDLKLIKLRDLVSYWEWKHSACHKFWINETYQELVKARQNLKEYKSKHYPSTPLLTQPKPFFRMNDWTEQYENYEN
jgi:hypothetical protein